MKNSKTKFTRERQSYKVLKEYGVPMKSNSSKNSLNSNSEEESLFASMVSIAFDCTLLYFLNAFIIKCAWNHAIAEIFEGIGPITLVQSGWLYLLSNCLFQRSNLTSTSNNH